ncbi:MAG TPA: type II secretion system protein N [Steroidobacteraceae bacterium]|jgi:hypothetical protein
MSAKSAILLAAAIFLLTVLMRLPAAVLTLFLPATVHCQAPAGTLWRGSCGELRSDPLALSDVRWALHPLELLHAQVFADIDSADPRASGHAQIRLHGNGDLDIRALSASLPLQGGLSLMPVGWSGTLELAIEQASIQGGHLVAAQGIISVRRLHRDQPPVDLGGFELNFPDAAQLTGNLRDTDGPLSLQGVLQLSRSGGYQLNGTVATRDASSSDLQQLLQMLGPADAQGRHAFSLAGTF